MTRLGWYLRRIRVMTLREILHHALQTAQLFALRAQHVLGLATFQNVGDGQDYRFCTEIEPQLPELAFDVDGIRKAARELTKGRLTAGGCTWSWDRSDDVWHRDPDTRRMWPRVFFPRIPYLEGNPYGDIRRLWEPSRLQHLVALAILAQKETGSQAAEAIEMAESQLLSWARCNPPLEGPHYISAMECALRLIAVCHAMDLLRGKLTRQAPWHALVKIVASHTPLIRRRLSLHSSTGNHTVAEACGLLYAGILFPEFGQSSEWRKTGLELLTRLGDTQVLPDGGGPEQATAYHAFNIQLFTLAQSLLAKHGHSAPAEVADAVQRGQRFLHQISNGSEQAPSIGDSDGGYALSRFLRLDSRSIEPLPDTVCFRDSGYTVARVANTQPASLVFDHGALGMGPSYGHGHADALSLILTVADEPILVDPGTYTYTGDPAWRRYFRSTRAHNTVTVDGRDQARQTSCFMWSNAFQSRLLGVDASMETGGRVAGEHNGYDAIGVRHRRGLAWERDKWILVCDLLAGSGIHTLELHWHLAVDPTNTGARGLEVAVGGIKLNIECEGGDLEIVSGQRGPFLGWRSPDYGVIEAGHTIRATYHGDLPHTFTTLITLGGEAPSKDAIKAAFEWITETTS